jgi:hypothetical protein
MFNKLMGCELLQQVGIIPFSVKKPFGERFERLPVEARFGRNPKVAVVEYQTPLCIDIDGDGIPDLNHATVVERFIKAFCPQAEIRQILSSREHKGLGKKFQDIARNRGAFDAVSFTVTESTHISEIIVNGKPPSTGELHMLRRDILAGLRQYQDEAAQQFRFALTMIRKVIQQGTKVYIGAGNNGPDTFNFYNLAGKAVNVGALDAQGRKAAYSADNSLLNRFEQGTFNIYKVSDGYDITGNGEPDVKNEEVSGKEPLINRFVGKPLMEVLGTNQDIENLKSVMKRGWQAVTPGEKLSLEHLLYPVELLASMGCIQARDFKKSKELGDFAFILGEQVKLGYRLDAKGCITYDPAGTGKTGVVSYVTGTSFAVPVALAKDLQRSLDQTHSVA